MADPKVTIRRYELRDRPSIEEICCDTSFFGEPIDPVFWDKKLFTDTLTKPYLDNEPENAWVAESEGAVVGYLLGSTEADFSRLAKFNQLKVAMKMIARYIGGMYKEHPRTKKHVKWLLFRSHFQRAKTPENAAHVHIELLPDYRGKKIGSRLFSEFEARMQRQGIDQVYATGIESQYFPRACKGSWGFEEFSRVPTERYRTEFPDENKHHVCVHKSLS